LRYYSRALEEDKSLVAGWIGQVQMLVLLEEAKEAAVWSRKALELFPGNGDLMAGGAQAHCRMGDSRQAHALCDGAINQEGVSAYRWMVRGELMLAGRQGVESHCFDKAQQIEHDWLVPLEISLTYLYYGSPGKALSRVRLAVEAAPECFHPWYVQGLCQMRVGLDRHARQSFNRCQELCPGHVDSRSRLAELDVQGWSPARLWRRLFGGR
jgi:Tfp pilus assembly protein PilF